MDNSLNMYIELPSGIEEQLVKGNIFVCDILKNLSNVNERISKLEEYSKNDGLAYQLIIAGLIHGILFDDKKTNDYFQYLFVINRDNYDLFLMIINSLLEKCHLKLSQQVYSQIFLVFDKLVHMNNPKLYDLMIMLARCVFPGQWLNERLTFYKSFLLFIKGKLNWIFANSFSVNLSALIFIKILRLTNENHFLARSDLGTTAIDPSDHSILKDILSEELHILSKLWTTRKDDILQIGKELIRHLIQISKANIEEINTILEDIATMNVSSNENESQLKVPCYTHLLSAPHPYNGFNQFVHIHIPPLMEQMLIFICTKVKKSTGHYQRYFQWLIIKFLIDASEASRSILVDIARYIVTCSSRLTSKQTRIGDYTPRWLLLGHILKQCKNEILSGEIKQAIFMDWLFYNKEKDNIMLIEPGILILFMSAKEYTDITMELIEFLEVYCENFDINQKGSNRECVYEAFKQAEEFQIIPSLKLLLKEEKIQEDVKKIYEGLIKFDRDNEKSQGCGSQGLDMDSNSEGFETLSKTQAQTPKIINSNTNTGMFIARTIDNDFFLHQSLGDLITPISVKNLLNFKTVQMFKNVLDEICKNLLVKLKSQNLLESKLISIQPAYQDIISHFANFYLNLFKDELIQNKSMTSFISNEDSEKTHTSFFLCEYAIAKFHEKSEKEFVFLCDFLKKIIEIYPSFIQRLIFYLVKKYNSVLKSKKGSHVVTNLQMVYFNIFQKIFDGKVAVMKEKIMHYFNFSVEALDYEMINYLLEYGFAIFSSLFFDDHEMIFNLIIYGDLCSINKICLDLNSLKYSLIDKSLYLLLSYSFDLNVNEQNKLWMLIFAQGNLNTSFKEFLTHAVVYSKSISLKSKSYSFNVSNVLFKNVIASVRSIFTTDIIEHKITEYYCIFDFPFFYSENVYTLFQSMVQCCKLRNFPSLFFNLIDEYLKQSETFTEKFNFLNNFVKLLKELVCIDRQMPSPLLLDNGIYSLKNLKMKLDVLLKNFQVEFD